MWFKRELEIRAGFDGNSCVGGNSHASAIKGWFSELKREPRLGRNSCVGP